MSSPTAVAAADDVVTVAEKPQRRFPPPCWTQEETLVLIEAYRERWYALRRGYLRTADWDAVVASVSSRCPDASPAKTPAQCRHKMEKLRQRFRAEKQRAVSFPHPGGRYFSSWFFFNNMEAMENGTAAPAVAQKLEDSTDGSRLQSLLDQNVLKLKLKSKTTTDLGFANGVKPKRFSSATQIPINYSPYSNSETPDQTQELISHDLTNYGTKSQPMTAIPKPQFRSRANNSSKTFNNFNISDGFNHQLFQSPLRIKNLENREFWGTVPVNHNNNNNNKFAAAGEAKRGRSGIEEIVASIKMLGAGYVRTEKAKMEMAREMEAARMEMEMKRNEVVMESQKQIVDSFLNGLLELNNNKNKNKKIKTTAAAATPTD